MYSSDMSILEHAGSLASELLTIVSHMLELREEREAEHMAQRRQKLASQARDNNDERTAAYWLDKQHSTDDEVRTEIRSLSSARSHLFLGGFPTKIDRKTLVPLV